MKRYNSQNLSGISSKCQKRGANERPQSNLIDEMALMDELNDLNDLDDHDELDGRDNGNDNNVDSNSMDFANDEDGDLDEYDDANENANTEEQVYIQPFVVFPSKQTASLSWLEDIDIEANCGTPGLLKAYLEETCDLYELGPLYHYSFGFGTCSEYLSGDKKGKLKFDKSSFTMIPGYKISSRLNWDDDSLCFVLKEKDKDKIKELEKKQSQMQSHLSNDNNFNNHMNSKGYSNSNSNSNCNKTSRRCAKYKDLESRIENKTIVPGQSLSFSSNNKTNDLKNQAKQMVTDQWEQWLKIDAPDDIQKWFLKHKLSSYNKIQVYQFRVMNQLSWLDIARKLQDSIAKDKTLAQTMNSNEEKIAETNTNGSNTDTTMGRILAELAQLREQLARANQRNEDQSKHIDWLNKMVLRQSEKLDERSNDNNNNNRNFGQAMRGFDMFPNLNNLNNVNMRRMNGVSSMGFPNMNGMPNIASMRNINSFPRMGGASSMPGMLNMPSMGDVPNINDMSHFSGIPNMNNMSSIGMSNINSLPNMSGISGFSGMPNVDDTSNSHSMSNNVGMPTIGVNSGSSGVGANKQSLPPVPGITSITTPNASISANVNGKTSDMINTTVGKSQEVSLNLPNISD